MLSSIFANTHQKFRKLAAMFDFSCSRAMASPLPPAFGIVPAGVDLLFGGVGRPGLLLDLNGLVGGEVGGGGGSLIRSGESKG